MVPVSNDAGRYRPKRHAAIARHRPRRHEQLRTVDLMVREQLNDVHIVTPPRAGRSPLKDRHAFFRERGFGGVTERS